MPFQPIPYSPNRRDTTTMLDLILRRGDIQARGTRNSANAWGDFANTLGQGVQMHFQEKERLAKEFQRQETKQLDESQAAERNLLFNATLEDNPKLFDDPTAAVRTLTGIGYSPQDAMAMAKTGSSMVKITSDESFQDPTKAMPYVSQMTQGYLEASPELQLQMRPVIEQLAQRMNWDPEENLGGLATEDFNKVMGHYTTAPKEKAPEPIVRDLGGTVAGMDPRTGDQLWSQPKTLAPQAPKPPEAPDDSGRFLAEAWAEGRAFPSTQKATTAALAYMEENPKQFPNKPRKLGVTQQQEVTRATDTIATIEDVRKAWEAVKDKVGPVSYRFNEFTRKMPGFDADPDFITFNTMLRGMGNLEIKRITGAQMSEPEAGRLLKGMATGTMKPADFEAALSVMERNARRNRDVLLYGKVVAAPPAPPGAAPPTGAATHFWTPAGIKPMESR